MEQKTMVPTMAPTNAHKAIPGDPRNWELTRYATAELNDLGKKLLGLSPW